VAPNSLSNDPQPIPRRAIGCLFPFLFPFPVRHSPRSFIVKKSVLLKKIVAHLVSELELFHRAAKAAFDEATDEQNKAENKYDTRGLEASYLARGQARQVADTEQAITQYQSMSTADLPPGSPVGLGALVELECGKESSTYFIGPCAGGTEIKDAKNTIVVITPHSPLGKQLAGKKAGDSFPIVLGTTKKIHKITRIS
jgi:transcription elongation GreA/GreB family factor